KKKTLRSQPPSERRADLRRLKRDSDSDRIAAQSNTAKFPAAPPATPPAKSLRRINRLALAAGVIVAVAVAVAIWLVRARQTSALTQKDTIVLTDFTNKTGDPVFD